jgi:hypothetical protein
LPPNFDPVQNRSLGLQIVHTLVTDDLKGSLQMESVAATSVANGDPAYLGARAIVTFPKRSLQVD